MKMSSEWLRAIVRTFYFDFLTAKKSSMNQLPTVYFSVLKSLDFYKQSTCNYTIVTMKIAIPLLQSRSDCNHTPPIAIGCNRRLQSKPPAGAPPAQGRPLRKSALRVGDKRRRRQKNLTLRASLALHFCSPCSTLIKDSEELQGRRLCIDHV